MSPYSRQPQQPPSLPPAPQYPSYYAPQPPPYHQYPGQQPYRPSRTSGLAIAALVLGIVSVPTLCIGIGIVLAPLGVALGTVALKQIEAPDGPDAGKGMAIAGIIIGSIVLLLTFGFGFLVVADEIVRNS